MSRKDSYILALYGSPKKESFSGSLHADFFKKKFPDTRIESRHLFSHAIAPCTGCNSCKNTMECVIQDDMQEFYHLIDGAALITLSFPIYFSAMPSHVKAFIDRCQPYFWKNPSKSYSPEKEAFVIISAGSSYSDMFTPSLRILRHFFNCLGFHFKKTNTLLYFNTDTTPQRYTTII